MPFANGTFTPLYNWEADAAAGIDMLPTKFDSYGGDIAAGLSDCLLRDGTGLPQGDIPFGGHTITGIRTAVAAGEPVEFSQLSSAAGGQQRLQNASLHINQRGVTGSVTLAAGAYGHDRWKGGASGCSYTFAASGADVQATVSAGSLMQVVAAADVDNATMTVSNAGNAMARVYPLGGTVPSFAACPVTATNLTPGVAAVVEFSTGTVLQPQLEPGASAHSFARKSVPSDLTSCLYYYEVVPFQFSAYITAGGLADFPIPVKSMKYSSPTFGVNATTSNSYGAAIVNGSAAGVSIRLSAFGGSTATVTSSGTVTISADL